MNAMQPISTRARQLALLGLYGGRVPRYTSYPPATQFSPAIDAELYAQWLRALPLEGSPGSAC